MEGACLLEVNGLMAIMYGSRYSADPTCCKNRNRGNTSNQVRFQLLEAMYDNGVPTHMCIAIECILACVHDKRQGR